MALPTPVSSDDAQPVSAISPFRFPVFRNVWLASTVSNLGGLIQTVGAAWLMTSISGSSFSRSWKTLAPARAAASAAREASPRVL